MFVINCLFAQLFGTADKLKLKAPSGRQNLEKLLCAFNYFKKS